ncbi:hypothetical protein PITC_054730 [Penicillium italicum]|uniref:Uncharacterized protein n=1 Tax=Penicillium italicum TaxID=40296 RepID=A0A0A2K7M0_PENIT|nr:hypothetical protein PITC_054730 [Penicillium italicum]
MRTLPGAVLNDLAYNDTRVSFSHCFLESLAFALFWLFFSSLSLDP